MQYIELKYIHIVAHAYLTSVSLNCLCKVNEGESIVWHNNQCMFSNGEPLLTFSYVKSPVHIKYFVQRKKIERKNWENVNFFFFGKPNVKWGEIGWKMENGNSPYTCIIYVGASAIGLLRFYFH